MKNRLCSLIIKIVVHLFPIQIIKFVPQFIVARLIITVEKIPDAAYKWAVDANIAWVFLAYSLINKIRNAAKLKLGLQIE